MPPRKTVKQEDMPAIAADHPRRQSSLYGHKDAVEQFASAFAKGRLAQGWLIAGPEGCGKATLAYHLARRLLSIPASGPSINLLGEPELPSSPSPDMALFRRIAENTHSDLKVLEAPEGGGPIPVEEVRALQHFLQLTAAEGRWRVAIIDTADAMNANAANALLKMLEEPPPYAVLFLLANQPGRVLPTLRSRCRFMAISPPDTAAFRAVVTDRIEGLDETKLRQLERLSGGSPGVALRLHAQDAAGMYTRLLNLFRDYPQFPLSEAMKLSNECCDKGKDAEWQTFRHLFLHMVHHVARVAAAGEIAIWGQEEGKDMLTKLAKARPLAFWLALWDKAGRIFAEADVLHQDRRQVMLDLLQRMTVANAAVPA